MPPSLQDADGVSQDEVGALEGALRKMRDQTPQRLRGAKALLEALLEPHEDSTAAGGRAKASVGPVGPWEEAARRALDRLERDLLPRTAGAHGHLVVGIVGPNNAGKSALFNSLVGRLLSPSLPRGGATRHLLGALHPELASALENEPTLARFPLRRVEPGPEGVTAATELSGNPAELFLVETDDMPRELLLIDTPDFDSILVENKRASESLLKVCDLAIVVVTRHTYQNRDVVNFLESWLSHDRPWLLVYNESITPEITEEHAQKLAEDLGSDPVAVFHAPFDLEIQRSAAPLMPVALRHDVAATQTLRDWLGAHAREDELKAKALRSSTAELMHDLTLVRSALEAEGTLASKLWDAVMERSLKLGSDVARRAMPMAPFLDAFRAVLDRRPKLVSGGLRGVVRRSRLFMEQGISRLVGSKSKSTRDSAKAANDLASIEAAALEPAWAPFFEELALTFAPSGSFWQRAERAEGLDAELRAGLVLDLAPDASQPAKERVLAALGADPEVLSEFQRACEEQIEAELEGHRSEWMLQFAVDTVHLLPAVAAGIVIFQTGGLGLDVAIGGVGALSTLLAERVSKLLGTQVAKRARERWTELRGARLARHILHATLAATASKLEHRRADRKERVAELQQTMESLSRSGPA